MSYRIGFVMEQAAGHITAYRNLRRVTERDADIDPVWHEICFSRDGGRIERLRERLPFIPGYAAGVLRSTWETRAALRDRNYDAVFCNTSVGVFFSRSFRRVPTMIDLDSTPLQLDQMAAYEGSRDMKMIAALKFRLARSMLNSAALVQAWSRWSKQSAVDDYGVADERVFVNPPGVDLEFWRPAPDRRSAGGPLKVLFVGGDFRRKGGEQLLRWYESQDPARTELHVVTRELVQAPPGVFVYNDVQPNTPTLIGLYQSSDLFVLPSLGECFGIATVEAMGAGLPVIASDVGGTADIIEPERNGFIVRSNDVGDLSRAIDAILSDSERRRTMGEQSRSMAEERFDLEKNARCTLDHLKQIAVEGRAAHRRGDQSTARV